MRTLIVQPSGALRPDVTDRQIAMWRGRENPDPRGVRRPALVRGPETTQWMKDTDDDTYDRMTRRSLSAFLSRGISAESCDDSFQE